MPDLGCRTGDFFFLEQPDAFAQQRLVVDLVSRRLPKSYGYDPLRDIQVITPAKQGPLGTRELNRLLQGKLNPPERGKGEATLMGRTLREGDKVMQIKNCDEISNGDIGYITKICKFGDETTVTIDFGDGRMAEYDTSQLDMLDLGYASTIHKSQGSEYRSVIINLQCAHYVMLTRPLVYTAITRGKENVIIVGERRALCMAIKKTDTEKRGTCLAKRLQAAMQ